MRSKIKLLPYKFAEIMFSQTPVRLQLMRFFLKYLPFIPYHYKVLYAAVDRPHYAYCIYNSLWLAKKLGYKKISIIEFGVAGGNGLLNIEKHTSRLQKRLGIEVEVYGFDRGIGLPSPKDYKDLPYVWKEGFYKMDIPKLKNKLKTSKLVLGDIKKTLKSFNCAPIACILFDLDYYSSTLDAFGIFKKPHLPRVYCYFDDVYGSGTALRNEYTGELKAIYDFNKTNHKKIAKLRDKNAHQDNIFILHDFKHPKYNSYVNSEDDGTICNLN